MDSAASWEHVYDNTHVLDGKGFNLLIHSDGGARSESSAAGWIVETIRYDPLTETCETLPLAMAGTFFPYRMTSFEIESVALRFCTNFVCELFKYI